MGKVIVWFRNDLRVHDNAALYEAVKYSRENSRGKEQVIGVFLVTIDDWEGHELAKVKIDFIQRSVKTLRGELKN